MDLIHSYKRILTSLGLQVSDIGLVSVQVGEEWAPAVVNGRRLVLPTPEVLADPDWTNTIAFSPLSEKIMRGESVVFKALRGYVSARLSYVIVALLEDLMALAVNTDRHSKLSPSQLKALRGAPEANETTLKRLQKILERVSYVGDHRIINIFLKRGGELAGKKYARVAVVSFPIADHIFEDGEPKIFKELFGVSGLSALDSRSISGLLNYIIPDLEKPNVYSSGSMDTDAPYFHALMLSYIKVAEHLNKITNLMANAINDPQELLIDLSWAEMLDDLNQFKGIIPPLDGNEGDLAEDTAATKRAGANVNAGIANTRVTAGVSAGGERVAYVPPGSLATAAEAEPATTGKLSSWSKASSRIHGHNPPVIHATGAPQPGAVFLGYDEAGLPVYGPPIQTQQQGPQIVTIRGANGQPIQGTYDAYRNFIPLPVHQQQQMPYQQPHHQQYGGYNNQPHGNYRHPQQQHRPLSGRQAANMNRGRAGFVTR